MVGPRVVSGHSQVGVKLVSASLAHRSTGHIVVALSVHC